MSQHINPHQTCALSAHWLSVSTYQSIPDMCTISSLLKCLSTSIHTRHVHYQLTIEVSQHFNPHQTCALSAQWLSVSTYKSIPDMCTISSLLKCLNTSLHTRHVHYQLTIEVSQHINPHQTCALSAHWLSVSTYKSIPDMCTISSLLKYLNTSIHTRHVHYQLTIEVSQHINPHQTCALSAHY